MLRIHYMVTWRIFHPVLIRAKESDFGSADMHLLEEIYTHLQALAAMEKVPDGDLVSWLRLQSDVIAKARWGSEIIFNLQGFFENPAVPVSIKAAIEAIFKSLNKSDLAYRFGPCNCEICTRPAEVLARYLLD